jgi:hypothetical protein
MITNSNLISLSLSLSRSLRTIYDGLGGLFYLDEAHVEVPNNGEAAVIAKPRDIHTANLISL